MNEIAFPPNLKPGRKNGRLERVHVCPQCQEVLFLTYEINEVIHGIFDRWVARKNCFPWVCPYCKHRFKLMSARSNCEQCLERAECLLHGTSEVISRKVYKPYSTIKPRRMTVWE